MFQAKNVTGRSVKRFIRKNISENVEVNFTGDLGTYREIAQRMGLRKNHQVVHNRAGEDALCSALVNSIESALSMFKRRLRGNLDKISAKHLQAELEDNDMSVQWKRGPVFFKTMDRGHSLGGRDWCPTTYCGNTKRKLSFDTYSDCNLFIDTLRPVASASTLSSAKLSRNAA